jgi:hypothetical protein
MFIQLTEKERLFLTRKKEEIYTLTCEILDIIHKPPRIIEMKRIAELKKRITGILSNISIIASYADPKSHKLEPLTTIANALFSMMSAYMSFTSRAQEFNKEYEASAKLISEYGWQKITKETERFCNIVNSIQFKLTKTGFKIIVPINIRFPK